MRRKPLPLMTILGIGLLTLGLDSRGVSKGNQPWNSSNANIPVRVLLERVSHALTIETLDRDALLFRLPDGAWKVVGSRAVVQVADDGMLMFNRGRLALPFMELKNAGPTGALRLDQNRYRGILKFYVENNKLCVVNVLPLETYLLGSLASEMSSSWPMEALKAQAVASRTYALYMIRHPKHQRFDLERGIQDQVYSGISAEDKRAEIAVKSTAGEYLSWNKLPVKSFYHSRCGGMTDTAKSVWNQKNAFADARADCPYCRKNKVVWTASFGLSEFARLLGLSKYFKTRLEVKTISRTPSGRISKIEVETQQGKSTFLAEDIRSRLGYTKLKSGNFDLKSSANKVEFTGVGSGHGVGLCQWGARHLAAQNKNYRQILAHYYPKLEFTNSKPPRPDTLTH